MNTSLETPELAEEPEYAFPASFAQEAFFYLDQLYPGATPFNVAVRFHLAGPLDRGILQRALDALIERHETLRTHFEDNDGELLQVVRPTGTVTCVFHDLRELRPEAMEVETKRLAEAGARRPFDLSQGPLLRVELVRTGELEHRLHVIIHHAVCDGWSTGILVKELTALYEAFQNGESSPLPELRIQYADFSVWQREFLNTPEVARQLEYWKDRLSGFNEVDLPTDHPRPPQKQWNGDIASCLLSCDLTDRLKAMAQETGATLFHVFLTAFKTLLHRHTGAHDIAVGTPIAGRTRSEVEPLIGTFINSVVLRTDLAGDPEFVEALGRVRDTVLSGVAHQDIPFEFLVRELRPERDPGRNPLFQINFTHQRDFVRPVTFGGVHLTALPPFSTGVIFDLHFSMVERDGVWCASCDFSTDLFECETIQHLLDQFRLLLEEVATAPRRRLSEFSLSLDGLPESLQGGRPAYTSATSAVRSLDPQAIAVQPETETEQQLAVIWRELLGVEELGRHDNFFDLGGHSLLALRLFSRIRRRYGLPLPVASLLRAPTLQTLGELVDRELAIREANGAAAPAPCFAPVQSGSVSSPFFCVHGGDGGVIFFRDLGVLLSPSHPLFAIEAPAFNGSEEIRVVSVEEIATRYLGILREQQPKGPYYLGGFSFGGLVAYEMARQLVAAKEKVAFLALFDSHNPHVTGHLITRLKRVWHSFSGEGFFQRAVKFTRYVLQTRQRREAVQAEGVQTEDWSPLWHAHFVAMQAYRPAAYPGKITLFKAEFGEGVEEVDADYGWKHLVDAMEIIHLPGGHRELFGPESVGRLAREVQAQLDAVQV